MGKGTSSDVDTYVEKSHRILLAFPSEKGGGYKKSSKSLRLSDLVKTVST